jgi:hypothetical protein
MGTVPEHSGRCPRLVSSPVQLVLDRLAAYGSQIKAVNGQWMAQCPHHNDRNPSLAVREGDEGAVVHCHAGCATDDVLGHLDLKASDLFTARSPIVAPVAPTLRPLRTVTTTKHVCDYLYTGVDGEPVAKVSRYVELGPSGEVVGKRFRQHRWEGPQDTGRWLPGLGGMTPPLYRLPAVVEAVGASRPVFVVEGEKDADAAAGAGLVGTTAPMGAGKWREGHTQALAGAHVIIVADDDGPGLAHATAVSEALRGVAASVVTVLPAEGCKDLTDHLAAGFGVDSLRPWSPVVVPAAPGQSTSDESVHNGPTRLALIPASTFKPARVRWGWRDRMPVGELTLVPGREGVGKSLFLAWLAAQITTGALPGEWEGTPRSVLYIASEDSWSYTIAPRMLAAGADLDLVYRVEPEDGHRLTLPADCDAIAEACIDAGAGALMLDPIISLIDDRLSVNQSHELRQALEPLRRAAERAEVIVSALAHFNKTTDTDTLSKIPGARAWAEVARAAIAIAEDREAGHNVASQIKNNLGRLDLPHLAYRIEAVDIDTDDGPTSVGRLVWTGESDTSAEEALSRRPERRARSTSEKTDKIVEYIEDCGYPMSLGDLYRQFNDISPETVRQVCSRAARDGTLSNPTRGIYGPGGERL